MLDNCFKRLSRSYILTPYLEKMLDSPPSNGMEILIWDLFFRDTSSNIETFYLEIPNTAISPSIKVDILQRIVK